MNPFDLPIFNFLHAVAGRWFLLDWLAILCAVYLGYAMLLWFGILIQRERSRKKRIYAVAWWLLSAIISRGIITSALKFFFYRQRPFVALGIDPVFHPMDMPSFPSGNMTFYAVLIAPVWYLNRKWGMIYTGLVVLMGIARMYGGVHWPTDIIGGLVLAAIVSYGVWYVMPFGKKAEGEEK